MIILTSSNSLPGWLEKKSRTYRSYPVIVKRTIAAALQKHTAAHHFLLRTGTLDTEGKDNDSILSITKPVKPVGAIQMTCSQDAINRSSKTESVSKSFSKRNMVALSANPDKYIATLSLYSIFFPPFFDHPSCAIQAYFNGFFRQCQPLCNLLDGEAVVIKCSDYRCVFHGKIR